MQKSKTIIVMSQEIPKQQSLIHAATVLSKTLGDKTVIIGGLAVSAWGHIRATRDIDFMSASDPKKLYHALAQAGIDSNLTFGEVNDPIPWVLSGVIHNVPFQVLGEVRPLHFENAEWVQMGQSQLRIVSIDDLILLKITAGGPRDLWDVAELLKLHPDKMPLASTVAKKSGCLEMLETWLKDTR